MSSPCSILLDGEDIHGAVVVLPLQHLLDGEDIHGTVVVLPVQKVAARLG